MGLFGGILGSLGSLVGGFLGGQSSKKASRKAQAAQLEFLNRALDVQTHQAERDRADFAPYRELGLEAIDPYSELSGLRGPEEQQSQIDAVMASPWYQALFRNGLEANLANASATGGIRGGNEVRSLADFGSDTLATSIDRQLQEWMRALGIGSGATVAGSQAGQNTSNAMAQNLGTQGQVTAGGILTRGGINSQMWNNAGAAIQDLTKWLPF